VIFKLQRCQNVKAMPAVSITCIREILPKFVGRKLLQILIAIPEFDINRNIWPIFVPNPPKNLIAVGLLHVADMVRQRSGANAP
jgi:hypothetical protein